MLNKRVFIKLSGEMLSGEGKKGYDHSLVSSYIEQIIDAAKNGYQIAIGVGGGNILRGKDIAGHVGRVYADYMGVLGTVQNGLYLKSLIEQKGVAARLFSAIVVPEIAENFEPLRCEKYFKQGHILIFAGGISRSRFTSDTNSAVSCLESCCSMLLKCTKVDGIYDNDPRKVPDARKYKTISYETCLGDAERFGFMDHTALILLRDENIPCRVFNVADPLTLSRAICGEEVGTLVSNNVEDCFVEQIIS